MTTLSKEDRENLNYILKKDTKKIMKSFDNLSDGTCDSLIRREVPVERLVRVAVKFDPSLRDELKKSKSIDEVFTDLAPEMSFFNHEILTRIIDVLGDKDDKECLARYSKEFQEFCKRKVFEIEPGRCTCGQRLSNLKQRKPFAVVLPTGEKKLRNLEDAVSIKETLSDILGVPLATLHLHRIDRGSIILVFSVPDSIAQDLFPLPKEKLALLRAKGMVLFVPQDLTYESNQLEDATKPLACSADVHEPSSKHTPTVPSGTPGELLVSHSLLTSAQLSWTPVPEDDTITGYTVQVEGPQFMREISIAGAATTSTEVFGLRPHTSYYFSVSAMTVAGTGPPARISSITPQRAPSGSPKWLTARYNHPTSVRLSWGAVPEDQRNGIITGYSIQIEGPDTTTSIPATGEYATSKEVSDLKPSTEYTFSVSAKTVAGSGPAISVSFVTPQEALSNAIGSLKASQYHPTSAQISWAAAAIWEDIVIGYTVQVEGPDSTHEILIGNKYITSVEISDLLPSTQYTFEVRARKVPGAPGELKVSHSLPTLAQLSWTPVLQNDTITGYIVQVVVPYSLSVKKDRIKFLVMDGNATSFEVSNLKPYTTYTFSVSAVTKIGTGLAKSVSSTTPQAGLDRGDPLTLRSSPDLLSSPKHDSSFQVHQKFIKHRPVLVSDPQSRPRLLPVASSPDPSLEPLEQLGSYSQEPVKHKADHPWLGLRPLPSSPDPSLKFSSYPQELIEHEAEQSTGDASLSMVLPEDYIKLRHLNVIKWNFKDESGKVQQLTLIKKIAHKWRTIGMLLGLTYFKLRCLGDKYSHGFISRQEECCQEVLKLWLDNPPLKYPATWQGLIKLLEDSQLEEVATELTNILIKQ